MIWREIEKMKLEESKLNPKFLNPWPVQKAWTVSYGREYFEDPSNEGPDSLGSS